MSIYNIFSTFIKHIAAASKNIYFIAHMYNLFHWNLAVVKSCSFQCWNLAVAAHLDFSDFNLAVGN